MLQNPRKLSLGATSNNTFYTIEPCLIQNTKTTICEVKSTSPVSEIGGYKLKDDFGMILKYELHYIITSASFISKIYS